MTHHLVVRRGDLAKALKTATTGLRGAKKGFAVRLDLEGDDLVVTGPGAAGLAPAEGRWAQPVQVDGAAVKALASRLPDADPLTLSVSAGRLHIGSFSLAVIVLADAPPPIAITMLTPKAGAPARIDRDATHHELLVAMMRHGESAVAAAAGRHALDDALNGMGRAIRSASHTLKLYGVSEAEIDALVREALRGQTKPTIANDQVHLAGANGLAIDSSRRLGILGPFAFRAFRPLEAPTSSKSALSTMSGLSGPDLR